MIFNYHNPPHDNCIVCGCKSVVQKAYQKHKEIYEYHLRCEKHAVTSEDLKSEMSIYNKIVKFIKTYP